MRRAGALAVGCMLCCLALAAGAQEKWLMWSAEKAQATGQAAYVQGRVGGLFDTRLLKTDRSYNYKLAATWLTPDVIRATARLTQLSERLSDEGARALVTAAQGVDGTVVLVEIDPREGSGVIPNDWSAFLQPIATGQAGSAVRGINSPALRDVKALAGVRRRNYDYDRFWVVFPWKQADGSATIPAGTREVELVVRIHDREGKVRWNAPANIAMP